MRAKDKIEKDIRINRPPNVSEEQWEKAMNLYEVARERGDKYPELTVAQAALETGWFKSPSGKYNYFGQKASESQRGSYKSTKEVSGNQAYSTKAKFRDYESLTRAVDDRIEKWGSKYADAENIEEALYSIWSYDPQKGSGVGYATDDKYDVKIKSVLGMMGVPTSSQPNQSKTQQVATTDLREETVDTPQTTSTTKTSDKQKRLDNLAYQNSILQEQVQQYKTERQEDQKISKAQAQLNEKMRQRDFLQDLIMESGVQFVQPKQRGSVYDTPAANSKGYPEIVQNGR